MGRLARKANRATLGDAEAWYELGVRALVGRGHLGDSTFLVKCLVSLDVGGVS